jgi:serine/threonine protein kinase
LKRQTSSELNTTSSPSKTSSSSKFQPSNDVFSLSSSPLFEFKLTSDDEEEERVIVMRPDGELLGRGSYGEVYKINSRYCTKVFYKTNDMNKNKQINNELEICRYLRTITHPNLVKIFEVSDREIIMEYCDEGTLRDFKGPKTRKWMIKVVEEIGSAMDKMHDVGLGHGDISARNVLMHQNTLKLGDFGLSYWLAEKPRNVRIGPESPPESTLTEKSDLYQLAHMILNMFKKILTPQEIEFLKRMMVKNPTQRLKWRNYIDICVNIIEDRKLYRGIKK